MKVYFVSRNQLVNGMILVLIIVSVGYLLTNYFFQHLVVPTSEFDPIYQGFTGKKQMSLAINVDWGEEHLPDMLRILEEEQVKATFFLTGRWAKKFPELTATINEKGHELGNHGYSHKSPNKMSLAQNIEEIKKTEEVIQGITGKKTVLFAPASGERQDHVLKAAHKLNYQTILWSIDTVDWKLPPAGQIVQKVVTKSHNGAIVLMHPTKPTLEALPDLIKNLKKQGYELITVSENINKK